MLDWNTDAADWPNRATSRFVVAGGLRWHVQVMGAGPVALLLHGTGASTHSWRDLAPRLARHFTVVAPDLPGHAFTERPEPESLSLPGIARRLGQLLAALQLTPVLGIGHSAGAAILARMTLDGTAPLRALVSVNGAWLPFRGLPGFVFAPVARLLARGDVIPRLLARRAADPRALQRLIDGTGSVLDAAGVAGYARLVRDAAHVSGALGMMARWDLAPLERALEQLTLPVLLLVGARDRMVPPAEAAAVLRRLPRGELQTLPGGHLMHEEQPDEVTRRIEEFAHRVGLVAESVNKT
jgi:magnesium chelatase accessory protein